MKRIHAPLIRYFALFFIFFSCPALSIPRLIGSYPVMDNSGPYNSGPLTFAFSEPINPLSVTLPQAYSNLAPSYETFAIYYVFPSELPTDNPMPFGGKRVISLEGGRIIKIDGSMLPPLLNQFKIILHKDGFKNFNDEPLDHDYVINFMTCDGCLGPFLRVIVTYPSIYNAVSDNAQPITVVFFGKVDPKTFKADLRDPDGALVEPLTYVWNASNDTYTFLTVNHPAIAPDPRPYQFTIRAFGPPDLPPSDQGQGIGDAHRITFGPAVAGDLNGDGVLTLEDAVLALRGAVGTLQLTGAQRFAADLAPPKGMGTLLIGDGVVDASDVIRILQRLLGIISDQEWP